MNDQENPGTTHRSVEDQILDFMGANHIALDASRHDLRRIKVVLGKLALALSGRPVALDILADLDLTAEDFETTTSHIIVPSPILKS